MIQMAKKIVTVATDHPMEEFLGIQDNSTLMTHTEREHEQQIVHITYDNKDLEIEDELTQIKREALDTFDQLRDQMDTVTDPRQKARLGEVSNQLLNTAISAVERKMKIKIEKDKLAKKQPKAGLNKIVNNNVFMDRNAMLEQLKNGTILLDGDQE
jgi:hypothetical protein